jgi:hypothetical protein
MGKNQNPDQGSGMDIPDHISKSLETIFWFNDAYSLWYGSRSGIRNLFDPGIGLEKFGSGFREKNSWIRNTYFQWIRRLLWIRIRIIPVLLWLRKICWLLCQKGWPASGSYRTPKANLLYPLKLHGCGFGSRFSKYCMYTLSYCQFWKKQLKAKILRTRKHLINTEQCEIVENYTVCKTILKLYMKKDDFI